MTPERFHQIIRDERARACAIVGRDRIADGDLLYRIPIRQNSRLRRALGKAKFRGGKPVCIEIASATFLRPDNDPDGAILTNTVRHEFAHIMAGIEAGHGPVWKAWARKLGANPSATCAVPIDTGANEYTLACNVCGTVAGTRKMHRAPHAWASKRKSNRCSCPGARLEVVA